MALITCPNCGKQISDTTEKCIHCGYQIVRCPECGKVLESEETQCKCCGYSLKKEVEVSAFPQNEVKDGDHSKTTESSEPFEFDFFNLWKEEKPYDYKVLYGLKRLKRILEIAPTILLGICALLVLVCKIKNTRAVVILLYITLAMELAPYIFAFLKGNIIQLRFCQWMNDKNIDGGARINERLKILGDDEVGITKEIKFSIESCYIKDTPSAKKILMADLVVRTILISAIVVSLYTFAFQNLRQLGSPDLVFKYVWLIVSAGLIAVQIALWFILQNAIFSKYEAWQKERIPELNDDE